ncbi:TMF1-regulated nuclear protein 1 [Cricetulus griseus]
MLLIQACQAEAVKSNALHSSPLPLEASSHVSKEGAGSTNHPLAESSPPVCLSSESNSSPLNTPFLLLSLLSSLNLTPIPPWLGAGGRALELAEARRRLLEVEGRRRLVSELESRVLQLHRVFLAAELRLAHRAESLSRLSGGVAQAELYLAAHGSRLKKGARRGRRGRPPALLASALGLGSCVPWGAGRLRRGHCPEPDSPFRRSPPRGPASPQR